MMLSHNYSSHTKHEQKREYLVALQREVFAWDDAVQLYPGHGAATTVGAERPDFETFIAKDLPLDLFGDVSWR